MPLPNGKTWPSAAMFHGQRQHVLGGHAGLQSGYQALDI